MKTVLLLWACQSASSPPPMAPLSIEAVVGQVDIPSGEATALTVEVMVEDGLSVQLQPPSSEELTIVSVGQDEPVLMGSHQRLVFHYTFTGEDGSHIIQPGAALIDSAEEPIVAAPIFVDIGVDGPSGGELAEFASAPEAAFPWQWLALGVSGLCAAAGLAAFLRHRSNRPAPVESPEHRARRRWTAARATDVSDPELALMLSSIFEDYLHERHDFPAQASTSQEILRALSERGVLTAQNRPALAAILEASDRLKFGRHGGGDAFFDSLEAAFESVLSHGVSEDA